MASRKVLLVGWDAADWKVIQPLMGAGRMPNVQRLVSEGATGPIATLHPPLSPMLWTSIATGKRPFKHGIHGFTEPTPDGLGVRPITNLSRKSKALWNILTQSDMRSIVIGWWPSHPAEPINGVMVSDLYHRARGPIEDPWHMPAQTVHPVELTDTLAGLRVHPDLITPEMVEPFITLAKEIDQDDDKRPALFLRTLAECMSIQSAAVWFLDNQAWDFFAVYFEAIDHFCHGFMRYHPPRQSWISSRDFELYRNVVSMAYQFHDEMLGELMKKAGEEAVVILLSDHGFHPDHLRPSAIPDIPAGPAIEHRDYGVLAIYGPGVKKQEHLHGASVLDITPTILSIFGLPVGEDMDGKVISQAFVDAPGVAGIPSWEEIAGADGRHPTYARLDPVAAQEALEQMIALGYIDRPDKNSEVARNAAVRDLQYNLGEAYQDDGRHAEALEIFSSLYKDDPDEQRFAVRLFVSCQALGLHDEMRRIVADLDGRRRALFEEAKRKIRELRPDSVELARWRSLARFSPPVVDYLKAQLLTAEKRYAEALAALERVTDVHRLQPSLFLQTAELYLHLGRAHEAEEVYLDALEIDPDNVAAHIGLCRIALRRREYGVAAQRALDALQRVHHDPVAHFLLGRALEGMKDYEHAAEAFRAAISFNPHFPEAHARLAGLLERRLDDVESAREHRRLAESMNGAASSSSSLRRVVMEQNGAALITEPHAELRENTAGDRSPLSECLIVVTGLPRSGTSFLMQMLAAGGQSILSDELRPADEDNPRGYLEYAPVKSLLGDSAWLLEARGKAIKIVVPVLTALPPCLPCRVIFCERDLEEVLDSQERMLQRGEGRLAATAERRRLLKDEFLRALARAKAMLNTRADTQVLEVQHRVAMSNPHLTAERVNRFLGGGLDVAKMAAAVDASLYRNRTA